MGWKCGKNNVMKISRQLSLAGIMIDQKQLQNMDYSNYLSSVLTDDTIFTRELNPGLPWKKQFQQEDSIHHHTRLKTETSNMLHLE
jgi:hypothetical protein